MTKGDLGRKRFESKSDSLLLKSIVSTIVLELVHNLYNTSFSTYICSCSFYVEKMHISRIAEEELSPNCSLFCNTTV